MVLAMVHLPRPGLSPQKQTPGPSSGPGVLRDDVLVSPLGCRKRRFPFANLLPNTDQEVYGSRAVLLADLSAFVTMRYTTWKLLGIACGGAATAAGSIASFARSP